MRNPKLKRNPTETKIVDGKQFLLMENLKYENTVQNQFGLENNSDQHENF